jgi:nicotinate phosphoribosyltransferase
VSGLPPAPDSREEPRTPPNQAVSPALLTDLYQLTMLQAYEEEGMRDTAVFSLFVRRMPAPRNFLVACGLEDVLAYLETLRFDAAALDHLATLGRFSDRFLRRLERFRFSGDVSALPEGTPVFANEPILEVVAPLPEAQFIETAVMNLVHHQTVIASKAARVLEAARGRSVVDFGLRRMHGLYAGLGAARAAYIAGIDGTSNVAAGQAYGIPPSGTMAHSYVQAHDDEYEAFRAFARLYPGTVLLVDTYDTIAGVRKVVDLARELGADFHVGAIRLDSGDLHALAVEARRILDDAGLQAVRIVASSSLNEDLIDALVRDGAPIDIFGVGTEMGVSRDVPTIDIVYKLVEYAGRGRLKLSPGKPVLPGRKQVFRVEHDGVADRDVLARHDERIDGRPLLEPVMQRGSRLSAGRASVEDARRRYRAEMERLPRRVRALAPADPPYVVAISEGLAADRDRLTSSMATP